MSQHDFDIANQSAPNARTDINNALAALASQSSGSTAPSNTYANMPWYDTGTNTLKMRSEADDAWISVGYLDQTSNTFKLFDDTQVVNSGGTQTGLLGDQATSVWQAGTGATESLVSPAKIKAAVIALAPSPPSYTQPTGAGQVGTYALLVKTGANSVTPGTTVSGWLWAGVIPQYSDGSGNIIAGSGTASGTWRAMGNPSHNRSSGRGGTVFLRIS